MAFDSHSRPDENHGSAQKEILDWAKSEWRGEKKLHIPRVSNKKELAVSNEKQKIMERDYEIIIAQMKREAEEYKADSRRLSSILSSVHLPAKISTVSALYAQTLHKTAEALEVQVPDKPNLMIGISDLNQDLETAKEILDSTKARIEKYNSELSGILRRKERLQRELSRLESQDEAQEQELDKMMKSTFYISKKKKQYELEIQRGKQSLQTVGFKNSHSHEELVNLGSEVKEMEEQLKPLRLQLSSYKDLPPVMTEAQVKLEEKRLEFKRIDKAVSEQLGEISILKETNRS